MALLLFARSLFIGTIAFACWALLCNGMPAPARYRHWSFRLMRWADGE